MPFRFASDIEGRLAVLEFAARSRLNDLEQRIRELEARLVEAADGATELGRETGVSQSSLTPRPRFDRKANHRRYMREWRRRRAAPRKS
jgi:hypothetical protein